MVHLPTRPTINKIASVSSKHVECTQLGHPKLWDELNIVNPLWGRAPTSSNPIEKTNSRNCCQDQAAPSQRNGQAVRVPELSSTCQAVHYCLARSCHHWRLGRCCKTEPLDEMNVTGLTESSTDSEVIGRSATPGLLADHTHSMDRSKGKVTLNLLLSGPHLPITL